jgi:hypothetical protein
MSQPPSRNQAQARQFRLDDFPGEGQPPIDVPCDVLCEDHVGTYRLPFPCAWTGDHWRNAKTGEAIEGAVVAWRIKTSPGPR